MSTAIAPYAPSLFDLEQNLEALLNTEGFVSPEAETEFRSDLAVALEASIEKRDRVGQFIRHCQLQQENCDSEIERLLERQRVFSAAEKRMRTYVQAVIESLGKDGKGKTKRLEGKTITFSLRAKPASIELADEGAVPAEYKTITVKMPLETWQEICEENRNSDDDDPLWMEIRQATEKASVSVSKSAIKDAIELGADIPGADLSIGGFSLVVK